MNTLIESTDTSVVYKFTSGAASRTVTYSKPDGTDVMPDFAELATKEHAHWLEWLGVTGDGEE